MAFRDFSFPEVLAQLKLKVQDADLFSSAPPLAVGGEFQAFLSDGVTLALANATEKAKSEFIIAPILLELRRLLNYRFVLFSGLEWDVDASQGLNGYCDFILTRGESLHVLGTHFVAIVEAKRDMIQTGLGQCIAAMYAAQLCNQRANVRLPAIHGVVSTGATWKFLRLQGEVLTIDIPEYYIDNLPRILGILKAIVETV